MLSIKKNIYNNKNTATKILKHTCLHIPQTGEFSTMPLCLQANFDGVIDSPSSPPCVLFFAAQSEKNNPKHMISYFQFII